MQRQKKIVFKLNQGLKKVPSGSPGLVDFLAGKVTFTAQGLGMSSSYKQDKQEVAWGKQNEKAGIQVFFKPCKS